MKREAIPTATANLMGIKGNSGARRRGSITTCNYPILVKRQTMSTDETGAR